MVIAAAVAGHSETVMAQPPLVLAETPDEQEGGLSDVGPSNTAVAPVDTTPLTIPSGQPSVQDLMRRIEQLEGRHQTLNQRLEGA